MKVIYFCDMSHNVFEWFHEISDEMNENIRNKSLDHKENINFLYQFISLATNI